MTKRASRNSPSWCYLVNGPDPRKHRCHRSAAKAVAAAKSMIPLAKRKRQTIEVEKTWSYNGEGGGHYNPWKKGAGSVWFFGPWDGGVIHGNGRTVERPQSGAQDPNRGRRR